MLSNAEFVRQSLGLHLFFARIMKEHSLFLELGFTPRDTEFAQEADAFRKEFDVVLKNAVRLSDGVVSPVVLRSGEVVTPYTLNAEKLTSFYTGVRIPTDITKAEAELTGGDKCKISLELVDKVYALNQKAIKLTAA